MENSPLVKRGRGRPRKNKLKPTIFNKANEPNRTSNIKELIKEVSVPAASSASTATVPIPVSQKSKQVLPRYIPPGKRQDNPVATLNNNNINSGSPLTATANISDNLKLMIENVIAQLKQKVCKLEKRIKELDATLILDREQYLLSLDNKDQEIAKLQKQISYQSETMEKTVDNFNRQIEMYNKLMDMTLKTNNLMPNE